MEVKSAIQGLTGESIGSDLRHRVREVAGVSQHSRKAKSHISKSMNRDEEYCSGLICT